MLGLQLGHDGPQLLFCLFPRKRTEGRDRSRSDARSWHLRNPGFKLADGALQAGEALSLSASPPLIDAQFKVKDSTEIEKASEGMGHLPRLTNQTRKTGHLWSETWWFGPMPILYFYLSIIPYAQLAGPY